MIPVNNSTVGGLVSSFVEDCGGSDTESTAALSWRDDPAHSLSDWTIEVVVSPVAVHDVDVIGSRGASRTAGHGPPSCLTIARRLPRCRR